MLGNKEGVPAKLVGNPSFCLSAYKKAHHDKKFVVWACLINGFAWVW